MSSESGVLVEIADSIADRTPVDWDRVGPVSANDEGKLRWLRLVEEISLAHREPGDETEQLEPAPSLPEQPLPSNWGPLVLVEPLGDGSLGAVYRARDTRLGCDVALKLLKSERSTPEAVERFIDEAQRLARVHHPNVLVVHGADRHDGRVGLWTELLQGRTLEQCLKAEGPFGAGEAAQIGIDLCHALAAVHQAGLVHRDVKTSNVMRERGGRIVLLDFSSVAEREPHESPTRRVGLSGTPLFMAPELFRGAEAGARSDLYSLGVLLYHLVSGRYPVEAKDFDELVARHERGETLPLLDARADLPQAFVSVVERALERDPARRWASAGEMERALAALVAPQPAPGEGSRAIRASIAVLAAVACVASIVLAVWLSWPPPFKVESQLFTTARGFEERLVEGARVAPGDGVFLEIESTRPAYVFVLNQDARGQTYVLFPLEGLDRGNPLPAGRRHRLPGKVGGKANSWKVGDPGGRETVLVVAATHALPDLERLIADLPRVAEARPDERGRPGTRGITGLLTEPETPASTPGLQAIEAALSGQSTDEIQIVEVHLDNPEP